MLGKPLLWVAQQAGHSVEVMLRMYAKWLQGATQADIDAIRRFMDGTEPGLRAEVVAGAAASVVQVTNLPLQSPRFGTRLPLEGPASKVSHGKDSENNWRRGWDSNRPAGLMNQQLAAAQRTLIPRNPPECPHLALDLALARRRINGGIKTRCLTTWRRPNCFNSIENQGLSDPATGLDFPSGPPDSPWLPLDLGAADDARSAQSRSDLRQIRGALPFATAGAEGALKPVPS
jgi:hypothetical protein